MMNFKWGKNVVYAVFFLVACTGGTNRERSKNINDIKMIDKENYFTITGEDGSSYQVQRILSAEFEELLNGEKLVFNDGLFKSFGYRTFSMQDGRIIIEESGNYAIYPTKELLVKQLEKARGPLVREILYKKNPYGEKFPQYTRELINAFVVKYELRGNNNLSLLREVDSLIERHRNDDFFNENFLVFISLIGESLIEEKGGRWEMYLGRDGITWTPYLMFTTRKLDFIHYIREDFFNNELDDPMLNSYSDIKAIIESNIQEQ